MHDGTTTAERFIGTAEAALMANVSEPTVRRMCARGRIDGAVMFGGAWRMPERSICRMLGIPVDGPGTGDDLDGRKDI